MSIIEKIDEALEAYYDSFEYLKTINSYKTDDNIGKFAAFCDENGMDDDDIFDELENGAADCSLVDFDVDDADNHLFPFNKPIIDKSSQNDEIFRIIKNMYIDAKSPQIPSSKSNYLFSGQTFVYKEEKDEKLTVDDVSLLLFGYIRSTEYELKFNDYVGGIPVDITKIMIFFYGKKFFIDGPAPNNDEYDYAMEILAPLQMIGIKHRKNKIISLASERSRNNIVYGSDIIQINDKYITDKIDSNALDKLLISAKTCTPSFIVFRCKKENVNKGTHLQFDISFDSEHRDLKFPYYKFTKTAILDIFNNVFGADGNVDIMEIFANKESSNGIWGSYGVSILLFIDNKDKLYKNYQLFDAVEEIENLLNSSINKYLKCRFVQKMESIKSNGINCKLNMCGRRTLFDLCFLIKDEENDSNNNNGNGRDIFYFVMVDIDRMDLFHIEKQRNILNITDHGHILISKYDIPPSIDEQNKILSQYKFYSNTNDEF